MFKNKSTFSVRVHGYGGQGIKTIANILAKSAIASGMYAQAFPEFGPERRGAPVKAYARFSSEPIMTRTNIEKPDFIIIMDVNTFNLESTKEGLGADTHFLINTDQLPIDVKKEFEIPTDHHLINCVDTNSIVADHDNMVHPSIPIIGRFLKITELIPLESVKEIVTQEFKEKIGEEKMIATEKALDEAYYKI